MGKRHSKQTKRSGNADSTADSSGAAQEDHFQIYDPEKYDLEKIQLLKKEFRYDTEMFILNNLLMAVMFVENYENEIRSLVNTTLPQDKGLNSQLIEHHQKQILLPDGIFEKVNNKVRYVNKSGVLEPLVSQRMYVLHHTVEIEDKRERADYSRIDNPSYRAALEDSKSAGFVNVNLLGTPRSSNKSKTFSVDSSNVQPLYQSTSELTDASTSAQPNVEYDYGRITAAKTPTSLYISETDIYTNVSQLPTRCITAMNVKNEPPESESDSENEGDGKSNERDAPLYRTAYYLNSKEFMFHFKNNIFPNYLSGMLGFSEEDVKQAKSIPGSIFCNSEEHWEIIPTIPIPWPEMAYEWISRGRRTVWDKRDRKPIAYKWPTDKMVSEAKILTCTVVPRGFMPKRGTNPDIDIEWEVEFPKVERFLELRMSHAQAKIYLFMIIIHKHFLESLTQKHGLLTEHLRHLMFWECEANFKAWAEDKLGTKLVTVLKNLYQRLSEQQMAHYFIRPKNILENIPTKFIISTQNKLHRITEVPLQMMISALRKVKYMSDNFYPQPDLDALCDIIAPSSVMPFEVQLNVMAFEAAKQQEEKKKKGKQYRDKDQKRRLREYQKNRQKRKLLKKMDDIKTLKQMEIDQSKDAERWDFSVKKRFAEDSVRQINLLTFFISLFIRIAKKSRKISTTNQTMIYLKQAEYLNALLEPIDSENGIKFRNEIKDEEAKCLKKKNEEPKTPVTPKRNSSFGINKQQIKGRTIDIPNLVESFDANTVKTTSGAKKKVKVQHQPPTYPVINNTAEVTPKFQKRHHQSVIEEKDSKIEVVADIHREKKIDSARNPEKDRNDEIINSVEVKKAEALEHLNVKKEVNNNVQEALLNGKIVKLDEITKAEINHSGNNKTELRKHTFSTNDLDEEIEITEF